MQLQKKRAENERSMATTEQREQQADGTDQKDNDGTNNNERVRETEKQMSSYDRQSKRPGKWSRSIHLGNMSSIALSHREIKL